MVAKNLYVLYEHAVGYALFLVKDFEELASQVPKVEKLTTEFVKFQSMVELVAFTAHRTANATLENALALVEGTIHEDLLTFLDTNLPKKRSKIVLGVADPKLGTSIQESMNVQCQCTDIVPEVLRGIKLHTQKLIENLSTNTISASELSLGRNLSRSKVKFNVNRADNMIIQRISLLDQLDKDINTFSMRLREWYGYHFPELIKVVPDNSMYVKIVHAIGDRKKLDEEEILEKLNEITGDASIDQAIISASKSSMGMDISPLDLITISNFSLRVRNLQELRSSTMQYLIESMKNIAPNLTTLIGETVGARLISHAGSLINLAKCPASTVQILGAEKALFRALKTRGNTPKHGLLYHSTYISKAVAKNKGRISRFLANKCSIATRIDCFMSKPSDAFGQKLREQVEERLKFFESGDIPRKNIDVMKEAMVVIASAKKDRKRKRKLEKEIKQENGIQTENGDLEEMQVEATVVEDSPPPAKKSKKKKNGDAEITQVEVADPAEVEDSPPPAKKSKKKKNRLSGQQEIAVE